jgi:DNA topoisomerase VI subunit A
MLLIQIDVKNRAMGDDEAISRLHHEESAGIMRNLETRPPPLEHDAAFVTGKGQPNRAGRRA